MLTCCSGSLRGNATLQEKHSFSGTAVESLFKLHTDIQYKAMLALPDLPDLVSFCLFTEV